MKSSAQPREEAISAMRSVPEVCSGRVAMIGQLRGHRANKVGRHARFVALDVDHDEVVRPAAGGSNFGDAVGAGSVLWPRHHGFVPVFRDRILNSAIVCGDYDLQTLLIARAIGNVDHHGFAGDVGERFAGQARRRVAGGNDDGEVHDRRQSANGNRRNTGSGLAFTA